MIAAALLASALPLPIAPSPTPLEDNAWTILVYGAADNDSEESFCPDMADLMDGLGAPGLTVLGFVDRSPHYSTNGRALKADFADARLFRFTPDGAVPVEGGAAFPEIRTGAEFEANSGDAATVARAIRWAKEAAPAKHYAVLFYSHGNGSSWCPDETSNDSLYPAELSEVLEERDSLDLVVFDVCSMAGIENAYEWRPQAGRFGVDVVVATPMAGFPFPWMGVFGRLGEGELAPAALTPERFGRLVVEETERSRKAELEHGGVPPQLVPMVEGEAMACLDLAQAAAVKEQVDRLAVALGAWDAARETLELLVGPSEDPRAMHYMMDGEAGWLTMPYFDLFDLTERLAVSDAPAPVREAADAVQSAVDAMVLSSYGLAKYDRYGGFEAGRHGLYLVFPDGDEPDTRHARRWGRFNWYHPQRQSEGESYGSYAWCRDGATPGNGKIENWFELLDAWYDVADDTGGLNGYRY